MLATNLGRVEVVKALIACPAIVESAGAVDHFGYTALMIAAENKDAATIRALLACPMVDASSSSAVDCLGRTALILASSCTDTISALLECPAIVASICHKDTDGYTALMLASQHGYVDVIKVLVACSATALSVDATNKEGNNALMIALLFQRTRAVIAFLTSCPPVIHLLLASGVNKKGVTALMYAVQNDNAEIVATLLAHPEVVATAGARASNGNTALMLGSRRGHVKVMHALLACPNVVASAGAVNKNGDTALMLASKHGIDTIRALLACPEAVASIHAVNASGYTALSLASECGHLEAKRALIASARARKREQRT
jgi:ankyrin repeat protein